MKKENKLLALLSYLGILFIIPDNYKNKSDFIKHHAHTGKYLFITKVSIMIFLFLIIGNLDKPNLTSYLKSLSFSNILSICTVIIIFGIYEIIGMINVLKENTKDLPFLKNIKEIAISSLIILSMFIIPDCFAIFFMPIIDNTRISILLANILYLFILFIYYKKDLIKEFKTFKNTFASSMKTSFKYYFVGLGIMAISNLLIAKIIGGISQNETLVRETMFANPISSFISIAILAPLTEEIVFRKSLRKIFKNKYFYAITCGILFGLAHIITLDFTLIDLIYVVPYGSLGFAFALAYYDTKSIYTPILTHSIHNTYTFILLIIANQIGAL